MNLVEGGYQRRARVERNSINHLLKNVLTNFFQYLKRWLFKYAHLFRDFKIFEDESVVVTTPVHDFNFEIVEKHQNCIFPGAFIGLIYVHITFQQVFHKKPSVNFGPTFTYRHAHERATYCCDKLKTFYCPIWKGKREKNGKIPWQDETEFWMKASAKWK